MYLLDTNVVSELRVLKRANANVVAWNTAADRDEMFLSTTTVMELRYGALALERRDPRSGRILVDWLENDVLPNFASRILSATTEIALACAALHIPIKRGERDAWIAATALVHDLTVVTRNTKDFEPMGVRLFNPWIAAEG